MSIDARAARWGDRTAIVDVAETDRFAPAGTIDDDRLTYVELATLSSWLADALATQGVEAGETVALLSRNRITGVALLFACRRLGATFAPISHRLTPVSVETPLSLLEPAIVLAESAQRDLVRSVDGARTVALESLFDADGGGADTTVGTDEGPTDTAADPPNHSTPPADGPSRGEDGEATPLLALNGSDGAPIATYSSETVEANCLAAVLTWGLGPTDRTVLLRPLSRPDGLLAVALPILYAGGRLALDRAFDPADAAKAIAAHGATHLVGTADEYRSILASDGGAAALSAVDRAVVSGRTDGELLDSLDACAGTVDRSFGWLGCPNALASDRGTPESTHDQHASSHPEVIGRPFLDVDARLVDDGTVVAGAGTGELAVSGPAVADVVVPDEDAGNASQPRRWRRTETRFRRDERGRYALETGMDGTP
ncbi:acyl-CoA synthetase (AMP-forming)/AMP-acid ligase II [Halovivax ruber XH-70]|uniref:Acyl-CoA synthetase (AMP-forming)/AMP-acid ligase II n=1 Tax=Halovivax ruber (strain DSM 18193 / JCM 13892 / XH-70) TaxID=797302 RepID=L0IE30_HALRX|nr:acyl-CoA synthetase (AMP-forming)/AMP-acid ligase II [Halovivax ruber XH-70]